MITRNDCLLLISELESKDIDTTEIKKELLKSNNISMNVLKFIHENKELDVIKFYEKLRKNYNNKKSKLYKQIVQVDEKEPKDVLVTLSSLLTQILLYSKELSDKQLFLKHIRAEEISKVLNNYFKTYDITLCISMLTLIKADLKALESIK